jgi:transposase
MVHTDEQHQVEHSLQHTRLEAEMVDRNKYGAIRELAGNGVPKKKIARQLEVTVKTVRRALKQPQWEPYQRQKSATTVLSQFEQWLTSRAPEVDFNAAILFRELKLSGYTGAYETVKLFVRPLREEHHNRLDAVMRFETAPGKQGQVDWGSSQVWLGDNRVRIHFFAMVLGYSRRLFARAYLDERLPTLLVAHQEAFAWFGGSPKELLYDNPKTIVVDRKERHPTLQSGFADFAGHYGFSPRLCQPYRPQTKGKIESGVKYIKRNFLAGRRFIDLDHLNRELERWIIEVADVRIHGTTGCRPSERFTEERLISLTSVPPYRLETAITRPVSRDCMITFGSNRYSVPWRYVGQTVQLEQWGDEIRILSGEEIIATHQKLIGTGQKRSNPAHYQGLFRDRMEKKREEPPRFDPWWQDEDVSIRDLDIYDRVANM